MFNKHPDDSPTVVEAWDRFRDELHESVTAQLNGERGPGPTPKLLDRLIQPLADAVAAELSPAEGAPYVAEVSMMEPPAPGTFFSVAILSANAEATNLMDEFVLRYQYRSRGKDGPRLTLVEFDRELRPHALRERYEVDVDESFARAGLDIARRVASPALVSLAAWVEETPAAAAELARLVREHGIGEPPPGVIAGIEGLVDAGVVGVHELDDRLRQAGDGPAPGGDFETENEAGESPAA